MTIIGVGCDIVEIARIEQAMSKKGFLRFLTEQEQAVCTRLHGRRRVEWIAGRFAAKEAIYKAISSRCRCVLSQIEILPDAHGAPKCQMEGMQIHVSISHEHTHAMAYAVALEKE